MLILKVSIWLTVNCWLLEIPCKICAFSFFHFASLNSSADELIKTASFGQSNQLCLICSTWPDRHLCPSQVDLCRVFGFLAVRFRARSWNYALLFGIFIILRMKRDFCHEELLVIVFAYCQVFFIFSSHLRSFLSLSLFSLFLFHH